MSEVPSFTAAFFARGHHLRQLDDRHLRLQEPLHGDYRAHIQCAYSRCEPYGGGKHADAASIEWQQRWTR